MEANIGEISTDQEDTDFVVPFQNFANHNDSLALTNGVPRKIKPIEDVILSVHDNEPEPRKESNDSFSSNEIFHGYTNDLIPDQARPQGPKLDNVTSQESPMKRPRLSLDESKVYQSPLKKGKFDISEDDKPSEYFKNDEPNEDLNLTLESIVSEFEQDIFGRKGKENSNLMSTQGKKTINLEDPLVEISPNHKDNKKGKDIFGQKVNDEISPIKPPIEKPAPKTIAIDDLYEEVKLDCDEQSDFSMYSDDSSIILPTPIKRTKGKNPISDEDNYHDPTQPKKNIDVKISPTHNENKKGNDEISSIKDTKKTPIKKRAPKNFTMDDLNEEAELDGDEEYVPPQDDSMNSTDDSSLNPPTFLGNINSLSKPDLSDEEDESISKFTCKRSSTLGKKFSYLDQTLPVYLFYLLYIHLLINYRKQKFSSPLAFKKV